MLTLQSPLLRTPRPYVVRKYFRLAKLVWFPLTQTSTVCYLRHEIAACSPEPVNHRTVGCCDQCYSGTCCSSLIPTQARCHRTAYSVIANRKYRRCRLELSCSSS